ncbi:MAG TPA: hypothetical protein DDW50_21010 [Firmicutes bacterium]|nr:hypothetical protein [Bacillota bacterium]
MNQSDSKCTAGVPKEPVLRERLEKVMAILVSAQSVTNSINGKLFLPRPVDPNDASEKAPSSNEMEFLIAKIDQMISRLETDLVFINEKL